MKVDPLPTSLWTSMCPWWASAIHAQMARPRPVPFGVSPGVIRAEEAVENLFMRVLRNADPVVAYSEASGGTLYSQVDFDLAARMRIFDRIVDEVEDELPQPEFVAAHGRRLNRAHDDVDLALLAQEAGLALNVLH